MKYETSHSCWEKSSKNHKMKLKLTYSYGIENGTVIKPKSHLQKLFLPLYLFPVS